MVSQHRSSDNPLRVCHLCKYYPPAAGGIEALIQTLARAQSALGIHVEVVCVNHVSTCGLDVAGMTFGRTRTVEESDESVCLTRVGRLGALAHLDVCPSLLPVLAARLSKSIDIIHLHTPNPLMVLALTSLQFLKDTPPLVISHHSDIVRQQFTHFLFSPWERYIYGRAVRILASSSGYAAGSPLLQAHADKVEVLPFGLDLTPFLRPTAEARNFALRLRARYASPIWLMVCRLVYYKGLFIALEALSRAPGTLYIIGTGPLEAPLRKRAVDLGIADRVTWHGHATPDELIGAYHAATALWFPSNFRSEAFGLVQIEAMASGCPVINTAIPGSGVAWVSRHEETGLTIPMNDPASLAAAAVRLCMDSELHGRLSGNARMRACAEFDHRVMAQRSLELYQKVHKGGRVFRQPLASSAGLSPLEAHLQTSDRFGEGMP